MTVDLEVNNLHKTLMTTSSYTAVAVKWENNESEAVCRPHLEICISELYTSIIVFNTAQYHMENGDVTG